MVVMVWLLMIPPLLFIQSPNDSSQMHPPISPAPSNDPRGLDKSLLRFNEDDAPVRSELENRDESLAYDYVVRYASRMRSTDLHAAAQRNITFANLLGSEASRFRGDPIHIEGRLRRIRDIGPTPALRADGIDHLYEGWIFSEQYHDHSYCVLFTELPHELSVGEKMNCRVAFDGYYFKVYRFRAGDGDRRAPLLVGRTITALDAIDTPAVLNHMSSAAIALLCGLIAAVVLSAGLIFWFRHNDRCTRRQLDRSRQAARESTEELRQN